MIFDLALEVKPSIVAKSNTASAGADKGTAVDTSNMEGPLSVHINAPVASSGDTVTFTVQHSETTTDGDFGNVPADALVDPADGQPATFTVVTDAIAVSETLHLIRDRLKRYVRIVATTAGSTISVTYTGIIIGQKKYV